MLLHTGIVYKYIDYCGICEGMLVCTERIGRKKEPEQGVCQKQSGYIPEFCMRELNILFPYRWKLDFISEKNIQMWC